MAHVNGRLTAAEAAQIVALVEAHAAARQRLTGTAVAAATLALQDIGSWWRTEDTNRAITRILRLVVPTQRQLARLTDVYLARVLSIMEGRTVRPVGAVDVNRLRRRLTEEDVLSLLRGGRTIPYTVIGDTVDGTGASQTSPADVTVQITGGRAIPPADVWGRLPDAYRYQVVSQGVSERQALRRVLQRAEAVADTDMTLATRAQTRRALLARLEAGVPVTGYRRVLRPELSQTGPCGLCVVAADRVYSIIELLPLHDRCKCDVLPIVGDLDPGLSLNRDDLNRLYQAAGGTTAGAALKRVRVAITEHGELGPVLVDADHNFRGPREVARTQAPDRPTRARAQLEALETSLDKLRGRGAGGEDVEQAIRWQENKIAQLRTELGI